VRDIQILCVFRESKEESMSNLEKAGRFLRLMAWLNLVLFVGIIGAIAIPTISDGQPGALFSLVILCVAALALTVLYLKTGSAMKQGKNWGKVTGSIIAIVSLLNVPLGTICGALVLFYLQKGWGEIGENT